MRPTYEDSTDRENEKQFARLMSSKYGLELRKVPKFYEVDFWAYDNDTLRRLIEFKCRDIQIDTYPTIFLSAHKVMAGRQYSERLGVPFAFIINVEEGYYAHRFDDMQDYEIGYGGRADRGDSQDQEPLIHVPNEQFKKLFS